MVSGGGVSGCGVHLVSQSTRRLAVLALPSPCQQEASSHRAIETHVMAVQKSGLRTTEIAIPINCGDRRQYCEKLEETA